LCPLHPRAVRMVLIPDYVVGSSTFLCYSSAELPDIFVVTASLLQIFDWRSVCREHQPRSGVVEAQASFAQQLANRRDPDLQVERVSMPARHLPTIDTPVLLR